MAFKRFGFTLVELMVVVAIVGILAAVAAPNFIRYQARSKQAEAKTNLVAIYTGERSFFAERDTFTSAMNLIGFLPDRGNRYAYHIGGANWQLRSSASVATTSVDIHGYRVDTFRYPAALGGTSPVVVVLPSAPICNSGWTATGTAAGVVTGNRGSFLASAAGNVDSDTGIDSWWVSSCTLSVTTATACRELQSATQGVPANAYNDVICP